MPRPYSLSFPNRSFPSSSFSSTSSSSSSSFSSSPATASTRLARQSSTYRLKRWLSVHLLSKKDTSFDYNDCNHNHNCHHASYDHKDSYTDSLNSHSRCHSVSQQSSTAKIPKQFEHEQEHGYEQPISQHHFDSFDYDYEYDSDTYQHQHQHLHQHRPEEDSRRERKRKEAEDLAFSDNYAAYCRAFTSSPTFFRPAPQPLPRLPPSDSCEDLQDDNLNLEVSHVPKDNGSQIRFLPVGAHGYGPAEWSMPRAPSPPPGILTPARYEKLQVKERERQEALKKKRKRETSTWCIPMRLIRLTRWSWARAKQC